MSVEKLTINELLDAYDYIMRVTTSGTPLYQRAESARYYLQQLLHYQKLDASFDHIRDLVEAEHGGLLVALPCKAGDTVYEISNNTDACNGCQHYEGIYGSGESWCMQIDDVDLRYYPNIAEKPLCEKQFMEVVAHKPEIDWIFTHRNDFGKTVFLTRAEAEQKLHDIKSELDAAASEHEQED